MRFALAIGLALLAVQAKQSSPDLHNEGDVARRAQLERGIAVRPGWKLEETQNYFVLSDVLDRAVVLELERRANGLRTWLSGSLSSSYGACCCCPGPAAPVPPRPIEPKCTIRLYASRADYSAAGGGADSNATYLQSAGELLLWAKPGGEGRKRLWRELQASVVAEYIGTKLGTEPQAPWLARGMQLLCAPFGKRGGSAEVRPDAELLAGAKELLAGNEFVPLDELLKTPASEFDASADLQAELWSFVWFLQRKHRELLCRYVDAWRAKRDADAATSRAFEPSNRADLEREWRAYIPTIK